MKLPDITIKLPEWQESDFRLVREAEKKAIFIGRNAGRGSDRFKDACRKLLVVAMHGDVDTLPDRITNRIDVRAFTFLLSSSEKFVNSVSVTRQLLDALVTPCAKMSKLALMQLIRAYFVKYDTVAEADVLRYWKSFIQEQLSFLGLNSSTSDLSSYAKYSSVLFSPAGPEDVVAFSKRESLDLDNALKVVGLTGFSNSRFLTLCRYQYYLETLRTIPVGSEHQVLFEIVKKDVINSPFNGDRLLGHALLEVLIDRSEGQPISQAWQSVILSIAGDPRVPKSSPNYQQWWTLLGEKRIALMRGWLSRFDLSLFLRVLEQSAKDDRNTDMERMFGPRKIFLEGLLDQRVVLESRLFLTRSAATYLVQNYKEDELPAFALVKGGQASVIYLRLENGLHLVEGTHSFSIRIMNKIPKRSNLDDYAVNVFHSRDLGAGLGESYIREFQRDGGLLETTHYPELTWQSKVIDYLSNFRLKLDVGVLIPPSQYREYKSKFGVY